MVASGRVFGARCWIMDALTSCDFLGSAFLLTIEKLGANMNPEKSELSFDADSSLYACSKLGLSTE